MKYPKEIFKSIIDFKVKIMELTQIANQVFFSIALKNYTFSEAGKEKTACGSFEGD